MQDSTTSSDHHDPDELEALGHEKIAEGNAMLARAKRLRLTGGTSRAPRWLDPDAFRERYGMKIDVAIAAAKRGELEIARVGRSPRVREDVADAWIASRGHVAAPAPAAAPADVYALAVERARRAK